MKRLITILVLIAILATGCIPESGYWVPPKAPPTRANELSLLSETALPDPLASPTPGILNATEAAQPDDPISTAGQSEATQPAPVETLALPTFAPPTSTPLISVVNTAPILYYTQAADTLRVVAIRFGVQPNEIASSQPIPETGFINPGQLLIIPRRLTNTTSSQQLIPDSEVVDSPSTVDFDAAVYAASAGGYLSRYSEWHRSVGVKSGGEIVMRVALENSINPRLLVALLEYRSGWVTGEPISAQYITYPMGIIDLAEQGLYNQLVWIVNQLSIGYYAYREGRLTEIRFKDGTNVRLAPDLNAGTAALQYCFAQLYQGQRWLEALDPNSGFPDLYRRMYGDPWKRAQTVEPLFPPGVTQPPLTLPFGRNWVWSYTGGPHGAWEHDGAYAALDFAPGTVEGGCHESNAWVVAMASGLVVRTGTGLVVIDLDGDGREQTGWVLVYLHIATKDRIPLGSWLATGEPLGHASCEGGIATGTHIHVARKFNGEWVPADGPLAFNLGGWIAHAGNAAYKGTLTRDGQTVTACVCSNAASFVTRTDDDP
jgi:LasA protease